MSKWHEVGEFLKGTLPILGTALGGPAGGAMGALVSRALGVENDPTVAMAALKSNEANPDAILKHKLEALELDKEVLVASYRAQQKMLETVNKTIRSEHNSDDPFVRRWRPFYGYAVAISWACQMIGFTFMFVYVAVTEPGNLPDLVTQFALLSGALISLWGIALAVLGVSVHKRSQDKQSGLDGKAKGFLTKILG